MKKAVTLFIISFFVHVGLANAAIISCTKPLENGTERWASVLTYEGAVAIRTGLRTCVPGGCSMGSFETFASLSSVCSQYIEYEKDCTSRIDVTSARSINISVDCFKGTVRARMTTDAQGHGKISCERPDLPKYEIDVGLCEVAGPSAESRPPPLDTEEDPKDVVGIRAKSWKEARYAYCSAQDLVGVLVDFQGADLEANPAGTALISTHRCNTSHPFTEAKPQTFNTTLENGSKVFHLGRWNQRDNYIRAMRVDVWATYSVFGGNSGPCVFLVNKGIKGLSDDGYLDCK